MHTAIEGLIDLVVNGTTQGAFGFNSISIDSIVYIGRQRLLG
jgi:hypothetical protein